MKSKTKNWRKNILIVIIIGLLIKTYIFNIAFVVGDSMLPTLEDGSKLIINSTTRITKNYRREDIIVLEAPSDNDNLYIKRVIAVPGDTINIKDGLVYRNGSLLEEAYINGEYTYHSKKNEWTIPENYLFVLGDNREFGASSDSRHFDLISYKNIKGKMFLNFF